MHTRFNIRRKKVLEALVNGTFEKARQEMGNLAKLCLHGATLSDDQETARGFLEESDVYMHFIKKLKDFPGRPENGNGESKAGKNGKGSNGSAPKDIVVPPRKIWTPEEKPDFTFDDIIGLDDVKKEVDRNMIRTYMNPGAAKEYGQKLGGGILLYGPPGTGKTSIARAVAGSLDIPFFNIYSVDVMERSAEKTVENIRSIFAEAAKYPRSIMFYDEVEVLFTKRTSLKSKRKGLLLMGSTNRPWEIRPAMLRPGRFSEKIYVGLPDEAERTGLFELKLKEMRISPDLDYLSLASLTKGYSGADIEYACEKAGKVCFDYFTRTGERKPIGMPELEDAIKNTVATSKRADKYDAREMEKFRQDA
jgi:SpoVK/Ycf46/Vps4 family AAA+-type ATPase